MRLPILILEAHSRCNCRCAMCDIWKATDSRHISKDQLPVLLESMDQLETRHVVFTGGEPLMNPDLFVICAALRERKTTTTLLSSGLLLERFAQEIVQHFDDVIVSLDGPAERHDQIRGIAGASELLRRGVECIHSILPDFPISARCVVQRTNHDALAACAFFAQAIGCKSISYLAADLRSSAFNRSEPWPIYKQQEISIAPDQLPVLATQLDCLARNTFVSDSRDHLQRILHHFESHLGTRAGTAPRCNAPEVSAYLRLDGAVQPCFFHPALGSTLEQPLHEIIGSARAKEFRRNLNVAEDETCRQCVCSLYLPAA